MSAQETLDSITTTVQGGLAQVSAWSASANAMAEEVLNDLRTVAAITADFKPPARADVDPPIEPSPEDPDPPSLSAGLEAHTYGGSLGNISFVPPVAPPTPVYQQPLAAEQVPSPGLPGGAPVPEYQPIPPLPAAFSATKPVAPVLVVPDSPPLIDIAVLQYTATPIAEFFYELPAYTPPSTAFNLDASIGAFASMSLEAYKTKLNDAVVAGTGLPAEIEARMMGASTDAVDRQAVQDTTKIAEKWASKNYSLIPGAMVADVLDMQSKAHDQKGAEISKVRDTVAAVALKNARDAIAQGVRLEQALFGVTVEYGRQVLEVAKIKVASAMALHNAFVSEFNHKVKWLDELISVYREQVGLLEGVSSANIAAVGTAAARADQLGTAAGMYEAKTKLISAAAQVHKTNAQLLAADADVYKHTMSVVKTQLDVAAGNIDAHGAAIKAYARGIQVQTGKFDALANQAQAMSSEAGIIEENANAYAAFVKAAAKTPEVVGKFLSDQNKVMHAEVQYLQESVAATKAYNNAVVNKLQQTAGMEATKSKVIIDNQRIMGSYYDALAKYNGYKSLEALTSADYVYLSSALAAQAVIETNNINAGILSAKAQLTAGLASGAMNAMHVQASASGSANLTEARGASFGSTVSDTYARAINYNENLTE